MTNRTPLYTLIALLAFIAAAVASCCLLTGCSALIPSEHKQQVAVQTAGELTAKQQDSVTRRSALPNLIASGKESKIEVTLPTQAAAFSTEVKSESEVESAGKDSAKGTTASSIPLFVKLIGAAVGLALLAGIIFWIVRSVRAGAAGAAAAAAFNLADRQIASGIGSIETMLHAANDPKEKTLLLAHLANLEKIRGKIATQAPAPASAPAPGAK